MYIVDSWVLPQRETVVFEDRREAGRLLADELIQFIDDDTIILALPRGGVPVAYEIALKFALPLSIIVARKIGAPHNPEFGVGAISENNTVVLDETILKTFGFDSDSLKQEIVREERELKRRIEMYRDGETLNDIEGSTIFLIDDGLATGITAEAAIKAVRKLKPKKIIFAAPVCAEESVDRLEKYADEVVCSTLPINLKSIGLYYKDFGQIEDREVVGILKKALPS